MPFLMQFSIWIPFLMPFFPPLNMGWMGISRSRFKQSKNSMLTKECADWLTQLHSCNVTDHVTRGKNSHTNSYQWNLCSTCSTIPLIISKSRVPVIWSWAWTACDTTLASCSAEERESAWKHSWQRKPWIILTRPQSSLMRNLSDAVKSVNN